MQLHKTLSYSAMHMAVAFSVALAISGSWKAALAIGTIEPIFQTLAYHLHERFWEQRKHAYATATPHTYEVAHV